MINPNLLHDGGLQQQLYEFILFDFFLLGEIFIDRRVGFEVVVQDFHFSDDFVVEHTLVNR